MSAKYVFTVDDLVASGQNVQVERSPAGNRTVMHGELQWQQLTEHLSVSFADCLSTSPMVFTEDIESHVSFSLCLAGIRRFQLSDHRSCQLAAGDVCVLATPDGARIRESWDQNQRAQTINLNFRQDFLHQLAELDEAGFSVLADLLTSGDNLRLQQASPELLFIAKQLSQPSRHGALDSLYNKGMTLAFLAEAARLLTQQTIALDIKPSGHLSRQLEELHQTLAEHPFTSLDIAAQARSIGISERRLRHLFVEKFSVTLAEHIRISRLRLAHSLLDDGRLSIGEVAFQCGYSNPANFSNAFRRHFGYTPASVRTQ